MAEQVTAPSISMALDMKKNRIRIHKPTIHMLGNPTLIQLLFDPDAIFFQTLQNADSFFLGALKPFNQVFLGISFLFSQKY